MKKTRKRTRQTKSKIRTVMHEFKHGTLTSSSGKKVVSRRQAQAIALSEAGVPKGKGKKRGKGKKK